MDGMMTNNSLKIYNLTKRSLSSDPSLSYVEPSAEPREFNFIYKRVGYIQERLKTQNQNHLLIEKLDSPTCIEDLNEVSNVQKEINTINTDFSVLRNKNLLLHTESANSNDAISAALANTGQITTDAVI